MAHNYTLNQFEIDIKVEQKWRSVIAFRRTNKIQYLLYKLRIGCEESQHQKQQKHRWNVNMLLQWKWRTITQQYQQHQEKKKGLKSCNYHTDSWVKKKGWILITHQKEEKAQNQYKYL